MIRGYYGPKGSPLSRDTIRRRKLSIHTDTVLRYRRLAKHENLSAADAIDLALREALERRGLPEEEEGCALEETEGPEGAGRERT